MQDIQIKTDETDIQGTIKNFLALVEEVPWGNSDFQNHQAIVNMELTPERAYRHASLRIMNRLQALKECYYSLRKEEIEIKKMRRRLWIELNPLEREIIHLDIEQKLSNRPYTEKLIRDAIQEIRSLEPVIQSIGKLTREKFEAAEAGHFEERYRNQINRKSEAFIALEAMGLTSETGQAKTLFDSIISQTLIPEK